MVLQVASDLWVQGKTGKLVTHRNVTQSIIYKLSHMI